MQLQRGLAVDPNGDPMAMTEDGFHCAYLRLHADLFQGSIETQKAALNAALPQEIEILGAKYGLRHEFETHYCAVCDRAGHQWGACRKPVSTPATAAPVPGASTSTSTSTTGFRVAGKNGKHAGPRANPAGAVTANKDDANDGDDEDVDACDPGLNKGDVDDDGGTRFDPDLSFAFVRWHVGIIGNLDNLDSLDESSTPSFELGTQQPTCHPGGIRHDPRCIRGHRSKNAVNQVKIIRYLKTLRPAPAAILLQEHHLSYNASRKGFERAPRFDGRILRSVFRLEELDVEIINMYAPVQEDDRRDFFGLLHFSAPRPKILRILASDLNDCPDVLVDRVSITDRAWTPVSHWQTLLSKIAFKALDTVRHVHSCTPAFTRPHYRGRGEERKICSWSRIDYILVQCSWANRLLSASTLFDAPCSDHRPVVATFALPTSNADAEPPLSLPSTSDFISRLNPMVFDDQDFVASIPGVVDEVYRRLEGTAPLGDVYDAALRAVAVAGHARYRSTCAESQSVMEALEARGEHVNCEESTLSSTGAPRSLRALASRPPAVGT
ncbi:BZ3501_MvSof-1269-A2-R1_C51g00275 [Microbotryum saponariae]|nr:BZ3501_MvSof-1269-A2-R1_C51g00275 [Microbotryum saponariae]